MISKLARFDDALIERVFQPLADSIMDRFGIDRFRAACFCLDAASIAWILSQAGVLGDAVTQWNAGVAFLRLLLLILGLASLTSLRSLFRRVSGSRRANPLRPAMLPHRGAVLVLLVAQLAQLDGVATLAELAMLSSVACALYLSACAPRPPAHRRAAWWAEARSG
ncbi:MAG: hypothetical protein JO227_02115 [Acetobacteraceae bacterium]|nr:hypothetical protein [Acetobacteraceae bacterium]